MEVERAERMIAKIVWSLSRKYGGDPADLMQDGYVAFLQARESYNPEKGTQFSTWAYRTVYRQLFETIREQARKNPNRVFREYPNAENDLTEYPARAGAFRLLDFVDGLSDDAAEIVNIVLETPGCILRQCNSQRCRTRKTFLSHYLRNAGWGRGRIRKTFSEIEEKLYEMA